MARFGKISQGKIRQDLARYAKVRLGKLARYDEVRFGKIRQGKIWQDTTR